MRATWFNLFLGLAAVITFAPQCRADAVDLAVTGGNLFGEFAVTPGSHNSESFTLNQDTESLSVSVLLYPYLHKGSLGTYEITVTAPGGAIYQVGGDSLVQTATLPSILPEGNYILTVIGGQPADPSYPYVAGIDYFLPATFTQIGGTINESATFGFTVTGDTPVPEPATWALLATALLFFPIRRYWPRSS